jgi:hypothetical protein
MPGARRWSTGTTSPTGSAQSSTGGGTNGGASGGGGNSGGGGGQGSGSGSGGGAGGAGDKGFAYVPWGLDDAPIPGQYRSMAASNVIVLPDSDDLRWEFSR